MFRSLLIAGILFSCAALLIPFNSFADSTAAITEADTKLDPQLNESVIRVPVDTKPTISLQVTIFKPQGNGPFPMAILNHGLDTGDLHAQPRYRSAYLARYFVSRGYVAVMPMMRGFAGSDGDYVSIGCDAEGEALRQAKDIRAVIGYMAAQPYIDANRIVVSGQSYGGWNTLALGALGVTGVRGLMNFAGGRIAPFCAGMQSNLAQGAGHFGAVTAVPSLWFYGENDSRFPPSVWQDMYRHYTAFGGEAELVDVGAFMQDSHNFLGYIEGLSVWVPKVDAFLARIGLPNENMHADLFPATYPAATGFAKIDDADAVPYLNAKGRDQYSNFLKQPLPRVFVIASDGIVVVSQGGYDPLGRALALCKKAGHECRPYAVDNDVVWQGTDYPGKDAKP
jgi:dienelactone hydrolase